jgi:hypothetical protein
MYFSFSVKDVSDEGNIREENELAKTGGNTADGEEKTNVVSCHHDEQEQVVKESTIATDENNCDNRSPEIASEPAMTIQEELKSIIDNSINEGKRRKTHVAYLKCCKLRNLFFP